tara:strand:+ start:2155 stop:2376 length:222 start_codon:yes stop_codon:yes gene_type:complete
MYKVKWFFIILFSSQYAFSQCAMCRVVAESSQDAGETIANGLNTGILYLMIFPYLLILFALISRYLTIDKAAN